MGSKERCNTLKAIRKGLADKLGIDLHQSECTFEGECSGTCPKCAHEEKILNSALLKKGAIALSAVTLTTALAGCTPQDVMGDVQIIDQPQVEAPDDGGEELAGDVEMLPEAQE
jgi:hypothetical protein